MYQYDPKRYRIAPWKGQFGDQAHALRVHPHLEKIETAIKAKKKEMLRLEQQIRQLEVLGQQSRGTIIDGMLVARKDVGGKNYGISLVSRHEYRAAEIYPNAHNGGKTYGLRIYRDGHPFRHEQWCGAGHTREQAVAGADAWVLRKEHPPGRYDRKDGTIREEPHAGR